MTIEISERRERLDQGFFSRSTPIVARGLLGCVLCHHTTNGEVAGRIVETEAYLGQEDPASHASIYKMGSTILSRSPGIVYMYRCMGIHQMFNIVAHSEAAQGAVLVRAVEPLVGGDLMIENRGRAHTDHLCDGPGRLTQAFGFTANHDGIDASNSTEIALYPGTQPRTEVAGRFGISRGVELPLRFYAVGSTFVSRPRSILASA